MTTGPDGAIWFTEGATGKIGRLRLDCPGPGGGGGGGGVVIDTPRFVRGPGVHSDAFPGGAGTTPTSARVRRVAPKGSALSYSLSERAMVSISDRATPAGRRVRRTCRAPTRSNRRNRRCTRHVTVGTLRRRGLQGANRVVFTGRIGRRALSPGSYRATATATDAAGNVSDPSIAAFTIVR